MNIMLHPMRIVYRAVEALEVVIVMPTMRVLCTVLACDSCICLAAAAGQASQW
jgi:hypothetical protein